jgi:DNA-binding HxlR family transcriptional regulator
VPQVLFLLGQRPCRFSELREALPAVSAGMLTERLRELCAAGMAVRRVDDGHGARITYALGERGRGITPHLQSLADWAEAIPQDADGSL